MAEAAERLRLLVVGLGTDDRSDDGIGRDVVRALGTGPGLPADLVEGPGDLTRLLELWEGREEVVLVDAVRSGAAPGTVHRWDADEAMGLPGEFGVSSHSLSLPSILRLARDLGRLPTRLLVYGIEVAETGPGSDRTEAVAASVPSVCRRIAREAMGPRPAVRDETISGGGTDA